jgi:hypothetical protein
MLVKEGLGRLATLCLSTVGTCVVSLYLGLVDDPIWGGGRIAQLLPVTHNQPLEYGPRAQGLFFSPRQLNPGICSGNGAIEVWLFRQPIVRRVSYVGFKYGMKSVHPMF